MERRWLNETHTDAKGHVTEVLPDENGDYTLEIVNGRGNRVSTFKGKSVLEVNEKLAEAQMESNRTLGRLLKPDKGREPVLRVEAQEITPGDRLRYASEINDPNKVVETVEEIVTKRQGVPPLTVGQRLAAFDRESAARWYQSEAEAFMADHSDYYPTLANKDKLFAALAQRDLDPTRNNLALIYEELNEKGELEAWPSGDTLPRATDTEDYTPAPPEPRQQPMVRSSGLRHRDATAMKPAPPKPRPVITRADLERMPRAEFEERLRDPVFRRAVDAMG